MQLFSENTSRRLLSSAACSALCLALLPLAAFAAEQAYGAPGKPTFDQRHPPGSIHTVEAADDILNEASTERELIGDQYIDDQRACYKKFFVSSCLENAKQRNRIALKQVRDVEVGANAYKRQDKADERDKSLAEQRVKDDQDTTRRAQDQKEKEAASARKVQESTVKQQEVVDRERLSEGQQNARVNAHQARVNKIQADEVAKAPQRAAKQAGAPVPPGVPAMQGTAPEK